MPCTFTGMPYRYKAEGYMRRVDLCNDGIIWGVLIEAVLDNHNAVKLGKTDQLGWKVAGVELRAVWVVGYSGGTVPNGERVGLAWYPNLGAHPMRGPWAARALEPPYQLGLASMKHRKPKIGHRERDVRQFVGR